MDGATATATPAAGPEPDDPRDRLLALLHDLAWNAQKVRAPRALTDAATAAWRAVYEGGPPVPWRRVLADLAPILADPAFIAHDPTILEAMRLAFAFAPQPESALTPPPERDDYAPSPRP